MELSRSRCAMTPFARVRLMTVALVAALALASPPDVFAQQGKGKKPTVFNVVPITITSVTASGGQLIANGLAGSTPFQEVITLTPGPLQQNALCPVLNLALGPIDLTLLGLNVLTSPICLDITADPEGGLLGSLLCGIANLLSSNVPLADVLAGLTPQQLNTLTGGLTQVLDEVFELLTRSDALQAATCSVLSLAIGPLELNLLGLIVELDDCSGGPVTLDITAIPGGGLLGDLLCNLTNVLNGSGGQAGILALLRNIASVIGGLLT
jgi:hypothetical protein